MVLLPSGKATGCLPVKAGSSPVRIAIIHERSSRLFPLNPTRLRRLLRWEYRVRLLCINNYSAKRQGVGVTSGRDPTKVSGPLAHLGERLLCTQEVVGSSPTGSTKLPCLSYVRSLGRESHGDQIEHRERYIFGSASDTAGERHLGVVGRHKTARTAAVQ